MSYGLKSVTMDDIARHLSVSKKTIYQFFKDKNDIVDQAVEKHLELNLKEVEQATASSDNAIEELYMISKCMKRNVETANPVVLFDLHKYFPRSYKRFKQFKYLHMADKMKQTMRRGISEGYFRQEINVEILSILRMEQIQLAFDQEVYPKERFNFVEVHTQMFEHFINGILTEKGRNLIKQYFK